ncbi:glycosyltransferase family 2 protein [Microbacterium sp. TPD7012]|uniref:glycosyltransferase family 2 protein n=3 Tax=Bacteria TaxID=2 RepID=UPI001A9CB020
MVQPIVSVVMATRDRPQLLRRAVASVFAQEHVHPIEVVLVYDGTPIDELDDLERGPHVLRAVNNARTPGLAGARNTGILEASAPLIAFCDDDDEWKPGKLSAQLPLFDDPEVVLAATGIEIHSAGGKHERHSPASVDLDDLLRSRITELHPSSFVIRAEVLKGALGLVDEELPASYGEDYDLLLRAAKVGRVRAVPEALTIIHWDRTSYFSEKWQGIADGLSYLLAKHPEFTRSGEGQARIEGQIAFAHGALGDRPQARSWARRAIGHDARQPRAYLAMLVGMGVVSGERVVSALNKRGRGM